MTILNPKGPNFLKYMVPLVESLKENGGSGTSSAIMDKVVAKLNIPENELEQLLPSGTQTRVRNQIQWARFYLTKAGLVGLKGKGKWILTEHGYEAQLNSQTTYDIFRQIHETFARTPAADSEREASIEEEVVTDESHSIALINKLRSISPDGFEKLSLRLLNEMDIEGKVTGRTGDQGIDGAGILKVNEILKYKVLFQCKRYKGSVGSKEIRDFRGAIQGRADFGLFITTGTFSREAKQEANRDGVNEIQLFDAERLVELFEQFGLGLKPVTRYELDFDFFRPFE